ncbi:VWA domain-containing protein [Actinoplanes sp. NPDC049265]|uniref:VWA domain-containing protein n=1 Tax=Actinoplanes sp. NPDC049265 TaxID=3363902 RepID=UPI003718EDF4
MTASPAFIHDLVVRLRRRGLPIGVDDYATLRSALAAGFGLGSSDELRDLCVALWASSVAEREMIVAAFAASETPFWYASAPAEPPAAPSPMPDVEPAGPTEPVVPPAAEPPPSPAPAVRPFPGVTGPPPPTGEWDPTLVVNAQHPLTAREIAQTWRRLRRPVRTGPPSELDIDATVDRYARTGVATGPVLLPPRRNTARLLLMVDRQGSMTPYHAFIDHLLDEIRNAGRLDAIRVAYFRNLPGRAPDSLLAELPDPFTPELDPVLAQIRPLTGGRLYADPALTEPAPLESALVPGTATAIISDAGAARGTFHTGRLLTSIALVKALHGAGHAVAWLNPAPPSRWPGTTAAQIRRHVPMFPLTTEGMYRAVDVLRGRPRPTERPA